MIRTFASLLVALGIILFAAPAHAEETPPELTTRVLCVSTDFQVTGSGWKVQAAATAWNEAQPTIRLTFANETGCDHVVVHHYFSKTNGMCGYTQWAEGIDIYLNNYCFLLGYGSTLSRRTVAHELGHAMGLPHIASTRSIMQAEGPVKKNRMIGTIDVRTLAEIYSS